MDMKFKAKHGFWIASLVVGITFISLAFSGGLGSRTTTAAVATPAPDTIQAPANLMFGLPVDSFKVISDKIRRNEFLANILREHHTDPQTIANLVTLSRDVFDVRNLRAGNTYTLFCDRDSLAKACYFVYQPNPVDYIVYDLRDSVRIYTGRKPVTTEQKQVSGVIQTSLFETLDDESADPALALELAKIFAWDIDFYGIKKGDWFKIVYDQQYVDGEPVALGRIKSVVFDHDGQPYFAFYFKGDSAGVEGYYDQHAKSLRKAFLKAPLKFFRITSRYTMHRFHPVQHRMKAHLGTDYAAPTGTPIMSTAAGVVVESRYTQFNGNYVKVRHNSVYTTQYLHMSRRAVRVGQHVSQGQVIGYVGSTGLATGPHVCYRFWKNGRQVDPARQHFPPAEPIGERDMPAFTQLVQEQTAILRQIALDTAGVRSI